MAIIPLPYLSADRRWIQRQSFNAPNVKETPVRFTGVSARRLAKCGSGKTSMPSSVCSPGPWGRRGSGVATLKLSCSPGSSGTNGFINRCSALPAIRLTPARLSFRALGPQRTKRSGFSLMKRCTSFNRCGGRCASSMINHFSEGTARISSGEARGLPVVSGKFPQITGQSHGPREIWSEAGCACRISEAPSKKGLFRDFYCSG